MAKRFALNGLARLVIVLALAIGLLSRVAAADTGARDFMGYWLTEDADGIIEIYDCGHKYCGRFNWLKHIPSEGEPRDWQNPDPALHGRPLCSVQFMNDFVPDDAEDQIKGMVYNPQDGQTYDAVMASVDHETLKIRGYVFHPLLGRSQVWHRTAPRTDCHGGGDKHAS